MAFWTTAKILYLGAVKSTHQCSGLAFPLAVALLAGIPPTPVAASPSTGTTEAPVLVIPIKGMIEPALLYVIRRGVRQAHEVRASAIVFEMDTPGGTLESAKEIVRIITGAHVPTYTYVVHSAFSAGAIIALATKHIYMAPGSVIGDAMPIIMSPFGGVQEPGEALEEKLVSGVAALIRAAAEQGGHDPMLAEAMVRRELEYRVGDEVLAPKGQLLTLTDREASRVVPPDGKRLLSEGTVDSLEQMLEAAGLRGKGLVRLEITPAERIARFIAALAPLFLMAGLLGIYIEIQTPGFGVPGILGALSLAIFFWGHHIAGLAGVEDLALFILGVALLSIEILILPGFGVAGLLGLFFMCWGLLAAMVQRYPGMPWYVLPDWEQLQVPLRNFAIALLASAVGAYFVGKFLPRSRLAGILVLDQAARREAGYSAVEVDLPPAGSEGVVENALRPSGSVRIGERILDAVTEGLYVEAGSRIRVVGSREGRVLVEPLEAGTEEEGGRHA